MQTYKTISISVEKDTASILLNRPKKGNAINSSMISELSDVIYSVNNNQSIRFIIISSVGEVFCAGADLNWMAQASSLDSGQNSLECLQFAELFYKIFISNKIVLSLVKGACIGGGLGLAVACDICLATKNSFFSFSEVSLGLVPAIISPYVIRRIGNQTAKRFMLAGEKINSEQALKVGLIDELTENHNIDKVVDNLISKLRKGGRVAQQKIKSLTNSSAADNINEKTMKSTAEIIANVRVSVEGVEGIRAFIEKRDPNWQ
jgi:methylglutaconyl-CoA hydratase